jgi:hypothetical protein
MGAEAGETCRFGCALNCMGPHAVDARFLPQAHSRSADDLHEVQGIERIGFDKYETPTRQ